MVKAFALVFVSFCFIWSLISSTTIVPPRTPAVKGLGIVASGTFLELSCNGFQPGAGTIKYEWFKFSSSSTGLEDWEQKGPVVTKHTLEFNPVTKAHAGKYKCRVSNVAGTRESEWRELYVYIPCKPGLDYSTHISPPATKINGSFTLYCTITKPTGKSVTWQKRDSVSAEAKDVAESNQACNAPSNPRYMWMYCGPSSTTQQIFHLAVTPALVEDTGYWVCNDSGLNCTSIPVRSTVQVAPGATKVVGFPDKPVVVGDIIHLKCLTEHTSDEYIWSKDGSRVLISLTYDFVVSKESAGVYDCIAKNRVGSATSAKKTLTVYYKPDEVIASSRKTSSYAGEADSFNCSSKGGKPNFDLTLFFARAGGGVPTVVEQGKLKILSKEDNQAEFWCVASVAGYPTLKTSSKKKRYIVKFPNTKVYFTQESLLPGTDGQIKKYTCMTDESNPQASSIRWFELALGSWSEITANVTTTTKKGKNGGWILVSELSTLASMALNGKLLQCRSNYTTDKHRVIFTADLFRKSTSCHSNITMLNTPLKHVPQGEPFNITCETDSANSPEEILFYRKRGGESDWTMMTNVSTEVRHVSPTVGKVQRSTMTTTAERRDNLAVYKCEVKGCGTINATAQLTVYYPANAALVHMPHPVRENGQLTLICNAFSGNPTHYSYRWFHNDLLIPSVTSREYKITSITFRQSGTYKCQVINYSPGGTVNATLDVSIQHSPKWNPSFPDVRSASSELGGPMKLLLHVSADPATMTVEWGHPNNASAIDAEFKESKMNATTFLLTKPVVDIDDFGIYPVKVTNVIGTSTFDFTLYRVGDPYAPKNLRLVHTTAVSATISFQPNFNGGSEQNFTLEVQRQGSTWIIAAKGIPDSGGAVVQKTKPLDANTSYYFRVSATNKNGTSGFGDILTVRTNVAPSVDIVLYMANGTVTGTWQAEPRLYTKMLIKYCTREKHLPDCKYHMVSQAEQKIGETAFIVDDEWDYIFTLEIYDRDDLVFVSEQRTLVAKLTTDEPRDKDLPLYVGLGSAGLVVIILCIIVGVFMYRRKKERKEHLRNVQEARQELHDVEALMRVRALQQQPPRQQQQPRQPPGQQQQQLPAPPQSPRHQQQPPQPPRQPQQQPPETPRQQQQQPPQPPPLQPQEGDEEPLYELEQGRPPEYERRVNEWMARQRAQSREPQHQEDEPDVEYAVIPQPPGQPIVPPQPQPPRQPPRRPHTEYPNQRPHPRPPPPPPAQPSTSRLPENTEQGAPPPVIPLRFGRHLPGPADTITDSDRPASSIHSSRFGNEMDNPGYDVDN